MCGPENMEITLEALRNGDAGLIAASRVLSSSKIYRERHFEGEKLFCGGIYSSYITVGHSIVLLS